MAAKKTKPKTAKPVEAAAEQDGAYDIAVTSVARATITGALVAAKGSRTQAAAALGMTLRRLYREIKRLELGPELDRLAAVHDWPPNPGSDARWK